MFTDNARVMIRINGKSNAPKRIVLEIRFKEFSASLAVPYTTQILENLLNTLCLSPKPSKVFSEPINNGDTMQWISHARKDWLFERGGMNKLKTVTKGEFMMIL